MPDVVSAFLLALDEAVPTTIGGHVDAGALLCAFLIVPAVSHAQPSFPISFFQTPFVRFLLSGDRFPLTAAPHGVTALSQSCATQRCGAFLLRVCAPTLPAV